MLCFVLWFGLLFGFFVPLVLGLVVFFNGFELLCLRFVILRHMNV